MPRGFPRVAWRAGFRVPARTGGRTADRRGGAGGLAPRPAGRGAALADGRALARGACVVPDFCRRDPAADFDAAGLRAGPGASLDRAAGLRTGALRAAPEAFADATGAAFFGAALTGTAFTGAAFRDAVVMLVALAAEALDGAAEALGARPAVGAGGRVGGTFVNCRDFPVATEPLPSPCFGGTDVTVRRPRTGAAAAGAGVRGVGDPAATAGLVAEGSPPDACLRRSLTFTLAAPTFRNECHTCSVCLRYRKLANDATDVN